MVYKQTLKIFLEGYKDPLTITTDKVDRTEMVQTIIDALKKTDGFISIQTEKETAVFLAKKIIAIFAKTEDLEETKDDSFEKSTNKSINKDLNESEGKNPENGSKNLNSTSIRKRGRPRKYPVEQSQETGKEEVLNLDSEIESITNMVSNDV